MKLLAIDGNSVLNRAFYGIRLLTNKEGVPTNGIYGFLTILQRLLQEVEPTAVAVAFDLPAPTFRHKMYDGYKAQRKGMPDDLARQMPLLKELLTALGYKTIECAGFEADDILGALSRMTGENNNGSCVIATGDRDSFQLIGGGTSVRLAYTKGGRAVSELMDEAAIDEKYGLAPPRLIDLKALMGDSSDNVPGVPGVGEKTALTLLHDFGSLERIYEKLDELPIRDSLREKLRENKELAFLSRRLVTIDRNAPIGVRPEDCVPQEPDRQRAWELMSRLELFSLTERFGIKKPEQGEAPKRAEEEEPADSELAISFGPLPGELFSGNKPVDVLFDIHEGNIIAFCVIGDRALHLVDQEACERAKELLGSRAPIRTNQTKELHRIALREGFTADGIVFDAEIAGYILNPTQNDYTIERLSASYKTRALSIAGFFGTFGPLLERCALFSGLCDELERQIAENGQYKLLHEVELPLARVLAEMEHTGVAIDNKGLMAYGERLDIEIARYQASVYRYAEKEFNLNSTKQLGELLFDKLNLPAKKKTKTGYSTDAEVLEGLLGKHPVVGDILEYRRAAKLKSTYVEGLLKVTGPDGRIHTSFQQTLTRTGRISSAEPNMQNIPVRTELGSELRRFFRAEEGWLLLDADYSQIELRVLAHIADDKNMIEAFISGEDIHTRTASQVFDMPPELVTPAMRGRAKAVNFGIVYGIGAYSLSRDIGVSVAEADKYIKDYLENFAGVRRYMEETVEFGARNGYVKTLMNRRRYLPELASSQRQTKEFGKRVALNTPIQGTSADIIKVAMVNVRDRLVREGLSSRLILQVHDELIVESPREECDAAAKILEEEMEKAAALSVPLIATVGRGGNWLEAK
ncbi:MAG: DNA polymerase I [Oscillospiraceae bacterium]|jgi:DNA polymerase-1|nr:DNA polymerase I [Oscillospiraceae bacterium]